MKLRNKKTGEIGYPYFQNWKEITCVIVDENAIQIAEYTSLAELNAEWEDAPEEQKDFWCLGSGGDIICEPYDNKCKFDMDCKEIGNFFETGKEAEKAVEKLKAWKRLRDKGFKWMWYDSTPTGNRVEFYLNDWDKEATRDLDLLFGGEE